MASQAQGRLPIALLQHSLVLQKDDYIDRAADALCEVTVLQNAHNVWQACSLDVTSCDVELMVTHIFITIHSLFVVVGYEMHMGAVPQGSSGQSRFQT